MRIKSLASEDRPNLADTRKIVKDIEFPDSGSLASGSVAHIGSQFSARFCSRSASAHKAYTQGILELTKPIEPDNDETPLPVDHIPLLGDEGPLKDYKGGNDWPRPLRNDHTRKQESILPPGRRLSCGESLCPRKTGPKEEDWKETLEPMS